MATAKEVILDLLKTYKEGIDYVLKDLPAGAWAYQPDPEANHIAVTIWHLARIMDLAVVMRIDNQPIEEELWFKNGWMEKTGYDPRGIGSRGLGILIGYSVEEMMAVPVLPQAEMMQYFDETMDALVAVFAGLGDHQLDELAPGGDPQRSYYEWFKICLSDGYRHTGEMLAIKASYERAHKE